jgi:hypothetical protein
MESGVIDNSGLLAMGSIRWGERHQYFLRALKRRLIIGPEAAILARLKNEH